MYNSKVIEYTNLKTFVDVTCIKINYIIMPDIIEWIKIIEYRSLKHFLKNDY